MPHLYTAASDCDIASYTAHRMLDEIPDADRSQALLILPHRRAIVTLRDAFSKALGTRAATLPKMVALSNLEEALLHLYGAHAVHHITALMPAMDDWQRLYLLALQVQHFSRARHIPVYLDAALRLAEDLSELQDRASRANVALTMEHLSALHADDVAEHWKQALMFLSIIGETWPRIEQEYQQTTKETYTQSLLKLLIDQLRTTPPSSQVWLVGSTASQPATADLMETIAQLPHGTVILPGYAVPEEALTPIHPYAHITHFLSRWPQSAATPLEQPNSDTNIWHTVLAAPSNWHQHTPSHYEHLRVVECQHTQEEVRLVCLMVREALENPETTVAVITPDETFLDQIASALRHYAIHADRSRNGTLAITEAGQLLRQLISAIRQPESIAAFITLLQHPCVQIGEAERWATWLAAADKAWRGLPPSLNASLPKLADLGAKHPTTESVSELQKKLIHLSRSQLTASGWIEQVNVLLAAIAILPAQGAETVAECLETLSYADALGKLTSDDIASLLDRHLSKPWRQITLGAHPNLFLLTPVEARLMRFDRVILSTMTARVWPGIYRQGPWLNQSQQQALGLPGPAHDTALMAHDVLTLSAAPEVFYTYAQREQGQPATRSPFLEKLLAYLALHGVEQAVKTHPYQRYAHHWTRSAVYQPSAPPTPQPARALRPHRLRVTDVDLLFSDPYSLYAKYVLGLKKLEAFDVALEPKDFGKLAHQALYRLGTHWQTHQTAATSDELEAIIDTCLAEFIDEARVQQFWRPRLRSALTLLNDEEQLRKATLHYTQLEYPLEADIGTITLYGRVDRIEHRKTGEVVIADYKTGEAPSTKKMLDGKATQLLAYALMVSAKGDAPTALEYWQLPKAGEAGDINTLTIDESFKRDQLAKLAEALSLWMEETTALLARPLAQNERQKNDYDGISRYDEWAG